MTRRAGSSGGGGVTTLASEPVTSVADTAYTHLASDVNVIYTSLTAARTVTLMASPPTGQSVTIVDGSGSAGTYNITVTPASGNVSGAASVLITAAYGAVSLIYSGSQWLVK